MADTFSKPHFFYFGNEFIKLIELPSLPDFSKNLNAIKVFGTES